ncbi:hypothetical protein PHMEG_00018272 [Phytophthora megakarya]|uniref:Uncharacterized protein n=1 Tax=Phytophthora megakarya TaxID=4795 RepID=A0A225VU65_9STRA|nr:hypothetical protein PHMEG_00018272 [Phytophthora megakarya]
MVFKANRHLISNTKSDLAWDRWLTSTQGETVLLLVYAFGVAIGKDSDLKEFKDACITARSKDRPVITQSPPASLTYLLRSSPLRVKHHLRYINGMAKLALNCINVSMADYSELRDSLRTLETRMDVHEASLASRKEIVERFIRNVLPLRDVSDAFENMENQSDDERRD